MTPRIGRQTPMTAYVLPYTKTRGNEAVDLYNRTGRTAKEWQELLISSMTSWHMKTTDTEANMLAKTGLFA